jgi:hypothetical protein
MFNFILIILAGIGITNLLVNSSILEPVRNMMIFILSFIFKEEKVIELLGCMMCSGFWVGIIIGICLFENPIYWASAISAMSFLYGKVIDYLEISTAVKSLDLTKESDEDEQ